MQTFLPYADFIKSAACLDYRRLGKQRSEVLMILNCLLKKETRWKNHPAVLMWKGYEQALILYGVAICMEWSVARGYKDTCITKIVAFSKPELYTAYPEWFGLTKFHESHQSNLLRKDKKYYSKFFKDVPDNLPYFWPARKGDI